MIEKAERFVDPDGTCGHIVEINGEKKRFVELGRDFSFGDDVKGGLYDGFLVDRSPDPPKAREIKIPERRLRK